MRAVPWGSHPERPADGVVLRLRVNPAAVLGVDGAAEPVEIRARPGVAAGHPHPRPILRIGRHGVEADGRMDPRLPTQRVVFERRRHPVLRHRLNGPIRIDGALNGVSGVWVCLRTPQSQVSAVVN